MGCRSTDVPHLNQCQIGCPVQRPDHWAVRTLNSDSVKGINNQEVTNEIGTASIDSRAEGLIPFVDFSKKLSDDVSIAEIVLYSDSAQIGEPLARWTLPAPVTVRDIPARTK